MRVFFYLRRPMHARRGSRSRGVAGAWGRLLGAERALEGGLGLRDCFSQDLGARGGQERQCGGGEPAGHGAARIQRRRRETAARVSAVGARGRGEGDGGGLEAWGGSGGGCPRRGAGGDGRRGVRSRGGWLEAPRVNEVYPGWWRTARRARGARRRARGGLRR